SVVVGFGRRDRLGDAAAAIRTDDQAAALAQPVELEGGEEQMQQTGVVGIPGVLCIELPIVRQYFDKTADNLAFTAAKNAVEPRQHLRSDEVLDSRRLVGKRAKH